MTLCVQSRRKSTATLERQFPGARLLDVTSKGAEPWVRFSPFYPHGGIPVPGRPDWSSQSVEGIWQALKVFETSDVDPSKLAVKTMKGIKRTVRKHGRVLGHRWGTNERLLPYGEARRAIYLPAYRWILEHRLQEQLDELRSLAASQDVILLDYETNVDIDDLRKPLSHAGLVVAHLQSRWPAETVPR